MTSHASPSWRLMPASDRALHYARATEPPAQLASMLLRGLTVVAALLVGLALIFWIAANWQEQSRWFRLGLAQGAFVLMMAVALCFPQARTAALLGASLAVGGLLALVGQTYQTGADAWQLFAWWAALTLPWTLVQRSDLLWSLWLLIMAAAITFWVGPDRFGLLVHSPIALTVLGAWALLAALPLILARLSWTKPANGLGRWSLRVAAALAVCYATAIGVSALFEAHVRTTLYLACLALAAWVIALACRAGVRDLPAAALGAMGINVLLMGWLVHGLLVKANDPVGGLSVLTLLGLGMLGITATVLLRLQRTWTSENQAGRNA